MPEVKCHDDTIIKIFVIEPVKKNKVIIEDSRYVNILLIFLIFTYLFNLYLFPYLSLIIRIISAAYDNTIKVWDYLTMETITTIKDPDYVQETSLEIS